MVAKSHEGRDVTGCRVLDGNWVRLRSLAAEICFGNLLDIILPQWHRRDIRLMGADLENGPPSKWCP